MMDYKNELIHYISELNSKYKEGITTEHSFRGALEALLKNMTDFAVVNEARHIACGAPDLTLLQNNIPVGYVEAKDIGKNLNSKDYKNQFDRYKKALDNLVITDYLTFQLFEGESLATGIAIGKILPNKIEPIPENFNAFAEMIKAFSLYNGKSIKDSRKLAEYMAAKTQLLAEVIEKTIAGKNESNSLRQQLKGFQQVLLPTMTDMQFADIYAQTIAYGMFVARLQDNSATDFTRQKAATLIPQSNPFLRNLFHYVAGFDLDENIRWIVDSLADMFNYVDVTAIHKEFESKDKDPFLHFYEDFLTKYDKHLKTAMGAYYTPLAVVKFIVNAVDDILKTDFNLAKGLADNSMVSIKNHEYHKIQILDPATGTGTFLAEVVRKIYRQFAGNAGMWNDYVKNHLIPRLNGFEIMMSPYTMAHLKMEMILQELGATSTERLHIYLTDALENPQQSIQQIPFAQWLSNEATEAAKIKNDVPVMVVLGNPPYSGESQNKGEWILNQMKDYKKEPTGGRLQEKNPKWLNDDYAKFIRFGQYFVEKNDGGGILAYINNHSFLDNPTFRGMRYNLLQTFDKIYILDLHGNAKKKETAPDGGKDENVFDIQQGVSINIFVKTGRKKTSESAKVFHYDLYGKRSEKYSFLLNNNLQIFKKHDLKLTEPQFFFTRKDFSLQKEYKKGFSVQELFPVNSVGIVTARDEFTIRDTAQAVQDTITEFLRYDDKAARERFDLGKDARDWSVTTARKDLTPNPDVSNIVKINYRPFDTRYTYYTGHSKGFHCMPRGNVMRHFLKGENVGLMVCRQQKTNSFHHCLVHKNIVESSFVSNKTSEIGYSFPLYLYHEHFGKIEKVANLNKAIVAKIKEYVGKEISPEQIFDYIYAILHSPAYRTRYKEFLKIDFPRIPYPENAEQFKKMVTLGKKLRKLHLMEDVAVTATMANFPKSGSNNVENSFTEKSGTYRDSKVWINDAQYFSNVPLEAWSFYIGGYQPAQKWLKDRKGRTLGYEDIVHYQKIIAALTETGKVMQEVDAEMGKRK
ncbi:MAG: N-6 DNA methylase [Prevotellaceae bacterium]|nr:N-6 DNA methylase [Prevotellaceae bacterium]